MVLLANRGVARATPATRAIPASQPVRATPATRQSRQAKQSGQLRQLGQSRQAKQSGQLGCPSGPDPAASGPGCDPGCQSEGLRAVVPESEQAVRGWPGGHPVPLVLDRDGETGNRSDERTLDGMQTAEQEAHLRPDGIAFQPVCDCGDAAPPRAAQAVVPKAATDLAAPGREARRGGRTLRRPDERFPRNAGAARLSALVGIDVEVVDLPVAVRRVLLGLSCEGEADGRLSVSFEDVVDRPEEFERVGRCP